MLHTLVVARPPQRYWTRPAVLLRLAKTRQVLTAARGPCLDGSSHEDEQVQCERALTLFSCSADTLYFDNGTIEPETTPLLSMTKHVGWTNYIGYALCKGW